MAQIIGLDESLEYDSFEDFIRENKLIKQFEKIEKTKLDDNYDVMDTQEKYGSDVEAISYYVKKFWKGTYYIGWSPNNDDNIEVRKVYNN